MNELLESSKNIVNMNRPIYLCEIFFNRLKALSIINNTPLNKLLISLIDKELDKLSYNNIIDLQEIIHYTNVISKEDKLLIFEKLKIKYKKLINKIEQE
jgi:hypothetical protein